MQLTVNRDDAPALARRQLKGRPHRIGLRRHYFRHGGGRAPSRTDQPVEHCVRRKLRILHFLPKQADPMRNREHRQARPEKGEAVRDDRGTLHEEDVRRRSRTPATRSRTSTCGSVGGCPPTPGRGKWQQQPAPPRPHPAQVRHRRRGTRSETPPVLPERMQTGAEDTP